MSIWLNFGLRMFAIILLIILILLLRLDINKRTAEIAVFRAWNVLQNDLPKAEPYMELFNLTLPATAQLQALPQDIKEIGQKIGVNADALLINEGGDFKLQTNSGLNDFAAFLQNLYDGNYFMEFSSVELLGRDSGRFLAEIKGRVFHR